MLPILKSETTEHKAVISIEEMSVSSATHCERMRFTVESCVVLLAIWESFFTAVKYLSILCERLETHVCDSMSDPFVSISLCKTNQSETVHDY